MRAEDERTQRCVPSLNGGPLRRYGLPVKCEQRPRNGRQRRYRRRVTYGRRPRGKRWQEDRQLQRRVRRRERRLRPRSVLQRKNRKLRHGSRRDGLEDKPRVARSGTGSGYAGQSRESTWRVAHARVPIVLHDEQNRGRDSSWHKLNTGKRHWPDTIFRTVGVVGSQKTFYSMCPTTKSKTMQYPPV